MGAKPCKAIGALPWWRFSMRLCLCSRLLALTTAHEPLTTLLPAYSSPSYPFVFPSTPTNLPFVIKSPPTRPNLQLSGIQFPMSFCRETQPNHIILTLTAPHLMSFSHRKIQTCLLALLLSIHRLGDMVWLCVPTQISSCSSHNFTCCGRVQVGAN